MTHSTSPAGLFGPLDDEKPPSKAARPKRMDPPGPTQLISTDDTPLVRVAFDAGGDNLYDYALPPELVGKLAVGQRLLAPFGRGNRLETGFCVALAPATEVLQVKVVREVIDSAPLLDEDRMHLAHWISQYYCCSLGVVLAAMVPGAVKQQVGLVAKTYVCLTPKGRSLAGEGESLPLSPKGRKIIAHLAQQDGPTPASIDTLIQALGCSKAPFTTLARAGLIEITRRREMSHPELPASLPPTTVADLDLNSDQELAMDQVAKLIDQNSFDVALLHGVTGSGKTEIYIRAIEKVIEQGKQALVLVPEIALTPQTLSRFVARFEQVALLHSGLSNRRRHQQWQWIAAGHPQVVVGARSAIFAPLPRLGLIVIDEEHEPSYKQETAPRYHGRDVALKLAQIKDIPIILGSATPSLETWHNAHTKKHYHLFSLPRRVLDLPLPRVATVNMRIEALERRGNHLLSRTLEHELRRCLGEKRQAILLLNRRGHSGYILCPSCQFVLTCPHCDVNLTCHRPQSPGDGQDARRRAWVVCHHCLHAARIPAQCPLCAKKLLWLGPGTQKAEDELQRKFPDHTVRRVDSDAVKPSQYAEILDAFGRGDIDILMGTQMIGKGLDFPNVDLVGVLNADTALFVPDFRSSERTFQLITQVAGRCGRAHRQGRVIVQSFVPDHPVIQLACRHDYLAFAAAELRARQQCAMPPCRRMARIVVRDKKLAKLEAVCKQLRSDMDAVLQEQNFPIHLRGPMPAPIARMEDFHRSQFILLAAGPQPLQAILHHLRQSIFPALRTQHCVDVDPLNLF